MRTILRWATGGRGIGLLCLAILAACGMRAEAAEVIAFGDTGNTFTGSWTPLPNPNPVQHLNGQYQTGPANFATSTWTFSGLAAGNYYVAVNWEAQGNRTTTARYTISDGGGASIVNQQLFARDYGEVVNDRVIGWKAIGGAVSVADGELTVKLDDNDLGAGASLFAIADAVRLSSTPLPTWTPSGAIIINDGDAGHAFIGQGPNNGAGGGVASWDSQGPGFNGLYQFDHEDNYSSHSGVLKSQFSFTGLTPGQKYQISATWLPEPNRATDAPFTVSGILGGDQTVLVDQESLIPHFIDQDNAGTFHGFQRLGNFVASGSSIVVTLGNNANEFVISDAVRLLAVPEPSSIIMLACCGVVGAISTRSRRRIS